MYKSGNGMQKTSVHAGLQAWYRELQGLGTKEKRGGREETLGWQQDYLKGRDVRNFWVFFLFFFLGVRKRRRINYNLPSG
ncbi:MAG: hypothetical protein HFG28_14120 [Eubacterium sp.]|nr:hypothetical protein [Eubacterium sp.]